MYSIYFNNRCLTVCSDYEQSLNDPDAVIFCPSDTPAETGKSDNTFNDKKHVQKKRIDLSDLPAFFQNSPQITKMYVTGKHEHESVSFNRLCTKLTSIQAGGGLVTNNNDEYLLIFRHGVWDLPKGKQEPDEDIRQAALREVEEECGVHNLTIKEHICETYHTYMLNDKFMLKCTHWYKMEYHGDCRDTKPQEEESIEKAIWVKKEDIHNYLQNSYPSIREVFRIQAEL